jgi:hypothetical protein
MQRWVSILPTTSGFSARTICRSEWRHLHRGAYRRSLTTQFIDQDRRAELSVESDSKAPRFPPNPPADVKHVMRSARQQDRYPRQCSRPASPLTTTARQAARKTREWHQSPVPYTRDEGTPTPSPYRRLLERHNRHPPLPSRQFSRTEGHSLCSPPCWVGTSVCRSSRSGRRFSPGSASA